MSPTQSPKYVGVSMEHGLAARGLNILIPSTASGQHTPISAVFLARFNVNSGYELEWSRSVDGVSLKGVEYKALPSGLHEKERDVISFVLKPDESDSMDELLYGVAVFHQNLQESSSSDRSRVKMYSLGVIVDPSKHKSSSLTTGSGPVWKPATFSCGIEHVEELDKLLENWKAEDGYDAFEAFFEQKADLINVISSPNQSPRTQRIFSLENSKESNHHYLLKLDTLLETMGPLIFKLWRCSLLRERIILFDAPSVELSCAFTYCLSILSTIPQEIKSILKDETAARLQFNRPIFSVGVNDIDWLKSLDRSQGYLASSSDEIIMYKTQLYDTAVQMNIDDDMTPKIFSSKCKLPGNTDTAMMKATQRDLKRFNVLVREYELFRDTINSYAGDDCSSLAWWNDVTEPLSWKHLAWSGFYWWASAGEKDKMDDETYSEGVSGYSDVGENGAERLLSIVGYFQTLTKRVFRIIGDIIDGSDHEETIFVEYSDLMEMGLDPYSSDDVSFVIKLIKLWWNLDAKVGNSLTNLCCF